MKALPQAIAGANFHKRDHRRKVERRDAGDDAERLAHRIEVDAGPGAVGVLAFHQMRDAEREFDHFDAALDVALGVGDRLAVLARQRLGQLVVVLGDEIEELHQYAGAALRIGRGPGRLRGLGVLHRRANFSLGRERNCASTVPFIGWKTSAVRPDLPATCLPPMKCPYSIIVPLPDVAVVAALCATILRTAIREIAHRLCKNVLRTQPRASNDARPRAARKRRSGDRFGRIKGDTMASSFNVRSTQAPMSG